MTRVLPVLLLSAVATVLPAQTTGAVEGTVRDPSGAHVPGARLTVVETSTSAQRSVETDEAGRYLVVRLSPGTYDIMASHRGFRDQVQKSVQLGAGGTVRADFRLDIGEASDRIVVTADASLVDASPSGPPSTVGRQQLEELPLVGRDVFELAAQQPSVLRVVVADQNVIRGEGIKYSVSGVRPLQNGFLMDGISIADSAGSVSGSAAQVTIGLDSMREVAIVTKPFSAEYGRAAGGVFTAVTKSGGNDMHGSAFGFFRHDALDARNFFDDPASPSPPLRRSQFGGLLSGPLVRNRVFYLVNYEGIREKLTNTLLSAVPNAQVRQGLIPLPGGGTQQITVANSVKPYLDIYPLPNGRDYGDGTGEYFEQSARETTEDYVGGKVDVLFTPTLRLAGRYTFDDAEASQPQQLKIWSFATTSQNQFAQAELQHLPSARIVHTFRAAYSRVPNFELGELLQEFPSSMSFMPDQPIGTFTVTGLAEFGPSSVRQRPRKHTLTDYQFNDEIVFVTGRNTLKAGGGISRVHFDQVADFSAQGFYQFSSLVEFLTARPRNGEAMVPGSDSARGWRQTIGFAYFQHEMKLLPELNVSYGVRFESAGTPSEKDGKMAAVRNFVTDTQITVGGPPYDNPSRVNFAPRAAISWDPTRTGRTVVRAGGGIFYDLIGVRDLLVAGVRIPPFFNRASVTRPPFPDLYSAIVGATPNTAVDTVDYNLVQPYVARYQFTVEQQIARNLLVSLSYAGTRGLHLMSLVGNVNATAPVYLPGGGVYLPPGGPRLNPSFSQISIRRTQFDSVFHGLTASLQRRWTNGLAFQVAYQWSKSIDNSSSTVTNDYYTTDSMPTVYDYGANRGLSDFDTRHALSLNGSYQILPGQAAGVSRIWRAWELHGAVRAQAGNPFAPTVGFDRVGLQTTRADNGQRPDFIGRSGDPIILGDPQKYFDPSYFGLPEAGFFGSLGRGTLIGPGLFTLDLALHKVVWQNERQSVRFRLEAFNATNHPNFRQPSALALFNSTGTRVGSAGRITETVTAARQIQLAVKWAF